MMILEKASLILYFQRRIVYLARTFTFPSYTLVNLVRFYLDKVRVHIPYGPGYGHSAQIPHREDAPHFMHLVGSAII